MPALIPAATIGKDRTKTTPTLRASASTSINNGVSAITVTIPTTAQAGDFAVFVIAGASETCSTPAGLTKELVSQKGDSDSQPFLHVYTRRLQAGDVSTDLGVGFTFTFGASDGICGGVQIFADTSGFGVRPTSTFLAQTDTINNRPVRPSSLHMGPSDLYAGAAAVLGYLETGSAIVQMSSPPTDCTITYNITALRGAGESGTVRGLAAWTGPTHAARVESLTYPSQVWASYVVFTLAPSVPHLVETDLGPPSLVGLPVYNYSNSSGSVVAYDPGDATRGANTYRPWPERVMGAFGQVTKANNMAMGGARSADICAAAYGNAVITSTRAGANNGAGQTNQYVEQVVTQAGLTNRANALYTLDAVGNDFLMLGTSTKAQTGARNALNALLRLIRAGTVHGSTGGGVVLDGTFAAVSNSGYAGGSARRTTTPGGTVTISVTDQPAVDIVLIALDSTALSITGATYAVKVDGVTVATGTTHNEMTATGVYNDHKFCQKVISVTGIAAGTHTVTVEHTGSSGHELIYNGYLLPAATPPWIVANLIWPFPAATYTTYGVTTGQAATYNQIVRDAAAQFTDGRVIVYDPAASQRWDPAVHVSAGDGLHQSELGHCHYGHELIRLLNERIPSPYSPPTEPTPLSPTTTPATFTLVGTRDFTVPTTGSYVLEAEGAGGGGGGGVLATGVGRGAGGGAYAKKNSFTLTAGSVLRVTVGKGGDGGPNTAAGSTGVASQVIYQSGPDFAGGTVLVKAEPGAGGGAGALGAVGTGGAAGTSVGDVKTSGSNGSGSTGGAGAAPLGGAGGVYSGSGAGTPGTSPGGGGSGANPGNAGGVGANGTVKLT